MTVLVTDGENRSALAVTRSLGRKGCRVIVTGKDARNLSSSSRYCSLTFSTPDPLREPAEYVASVREIVAREAVNFVFPMTEQSIQLLNPYREKLGRCVLACPPSEIMQAVCDKSALCRLAERLDVPVPVTFYLADHTELPAVIGRVKRYPVVVKPALSRMLEGDKFLSGAVTYAASPSELQEIYRTQRVLRYPSLIQERIIGQGMGLFTLFDDDRPVALFSHRRLLEKPPSGGVSVVCESTPLDEQMVEASRRLLTAVKWKGVAMVEFKRDQRDGKAKLMEINGRFWGSLQLAISCGVDFPALLLDHLQGNGPETVNPAYLTGHKLKWVLGILDHLLIRLKYGNKMVQLPEGTPSLLQTIGELLKVFEANCSLDTIDRLDWRPFCLEACTYLRQALNASS